MSRPSCIMEIVSHSQEGANMPTIYTMTPIGFHEEEPTKVVTRVGCAWCGTFHSVEKWVPGWVCSSCRPCLVERIENDEA